MKHSFCISFWLMTAWLLPCTLVSAQTPFDAFSPETSRIILDGDSIAAWRAEQQSQLSRRNTTLSRPDTILCTLIADLRNEQLLLVDIATHRPIAAAPFTDEIKNWLSVDPLVDKNISTSPYLYCNGNPIMFIDPDGMIPNEIEAAAMAAYAYGDADENKLNEQLGKWEPIEKPDVFFGYRAVLFGRDVDGKKEYAYAFAGTDSHSVFDIVSDIAQATDCLSQYEIAIAMARFMAFKYRGEVLTFVGHSLGGGEATAAAMATGKKSYNV